METSGSVIWTFGRTVVICCIIFCLGAIVYWLRVDRNGAVFDMRSWSDNVRGRLMMTYCHLTTSCLLSCFSTAYVLCSPKLLEILTYYSGHIIIGEIFIMSGLTTLLEVIPFSSDTKVLKNFIWVLHSTSLGLPIAYFGSYIGTKSALTTSIFIILATVVSFTAPKDFYKILCKHITNLYFAIGICSLASILNIPPVTPMAKLILTVNFFGGIILYFTVFIINLQYLLHEAESCREFDPVYSSAVIYLCAMNLYIRIGMCYIAELIILSHPCAYISQRSNQ